jgi:hypothetical protein
VGAVVVGRQFRSSRCTDNGFLEECISAGSEKRKEERKCKTIAKMCGNNDKSGWITVMTTENKAGLTYDIGLAKLAWRDGLNNGCAMKE